MSGEVDQRPVVDDAAPDFADDDRLHAVEGSHEGYRRSPRYDSAEPSACPGAGQHAPGSVG